MQRRPVARKPVGRRRSRRVRSQKDRTTLRRHHQPKLKYTKVRRGSDNQPVLPHTQRRPSQPQTPSNTVTATQANPQSTNAPGDQKGRGRAGQSRHQTGREQAMFRTSQAKLNKIHKGKSRRTQGAPGEQHRHIQRQSKATTRHPIRQALTQQRHSRPYTGHRRVRTSHTNVTPVPQPSNRHHQERGPSPHPQATPPPTRHRVHQLPTRKLVPNKGHTQPPPRKLLHHRHTVSKDQAVGNGSGGNRPLSVVIRNAPVAGNDIRP